uniref:Ig-like domain-containing protein n=1 Tax=Pundamilia nyererei TaxID=303518 RepID=A0A3B4H9N3_9CICH
CSVMKSQTIIILNSFYIKTNTKWCTQRHTMTYIETAATGWNESPELTEVIFVNGQEFVHYKSSLKKMVPKTEWIEKTVDPEYWERERQRNIHNEQAIKAHVVWLMERLNQTSGVHILQWMYGCEWNEDTEEVTGFEILGYDGRDYVAFDLKTETYIASAPQSLLLRFLVSFHAFIVSFHLFLITLHRYFSRDTLVIPPSVSLLQKTPSSPISCHATGFFPNVAEMFWRKDGEELHEGVHKGEILPNNDETFQMSVDLKLSSVKPEDWERHECVFQLRNPNKHFRESKNAQVAKSIIRCIIKQGMLERLYPSRGLGFSRKKMDGLLNRMNALTSSATTKGLKDHRRQLK